MANDSMRGGPRGSSEQAAFVGPTIFKLARLNGNRNIDKSDSASAGTVYSSGEAFGVDYQVIAVQLFVSDEAVDTADIQCTLGYNGNPTGSVTADLDAFVNTTAALGSATAAAGSVHDIALSGNAVSATFGATNGPLVFVNNGAPSGTGNYTVAVLAKPVSGTYYSN
tara:strand:- start:66 stop:566 length:501 start_codon:yes stop_codon:yes gene_type:complete